VCHSIEMLIVKILENRVCLNIYLSGITFVELGYDGAAKGMDATGKT